MVELLLLPNPMGKESLRFKQFKFCCPKTPNPCSVPKLLSGERNQSAFCYSLLLRLSFSNSCSNEPHSNSSYLSCFHFSLVFCKLNCTLCSTMPLSFVKLSLLFCILLPPSDLHLSATEMDHFVCRDFYNFLNSSGLFLFSDEVMSVKHMSSFSCLSICCICISVGSCTRLRILFGYLFCFFVCFSKGTSVSEKENENF